MKKKITFLSMLLALLLLSIPFTSCGGDDEDEPTQSSLIVGTWIGSAVDDGYSKTYEYDFKANGTFTWKVSFTDNPDRFMIFPGTYTYDANKGILYVKSVDEDGDVFEESVPCKISGNQMEVESDGKYLTLHRK